MRAHLHDFTTVHDHDAIRVNDSGQPVRDDERGPVAQQVGERGLDEQLAGAVKRAGRLVEQDDRRIDAQGAGNGDALPLPLAKLVRAFAHQRVIAVRQARGELVHEFATRLPDGYDTLVGEGAHKLSQGERQRVAIARALCIDPAVILFDEATSSLDSAGELLIQAALANLLRNRTAFIIAHRLATVIDADCIVVMDGGEIMQMGTHGELLADADGLYRQLCVRQFGSRERDTSKTDSVA